MSTRATYRFSGNRFPTTTIYIHHDGYPQGAAMYLWEAYKLYRKSGRGGLVTCFIRANEGAELTKSHDAHGDTEYRYDIVSGDGDDITVTVHKGGEDKFRSVWSGSLVDFLNGNDGFISDADFKPLQLMALPEFSHVRPFNAELAKNVIESAVYHLEIWSTGGRVSRTDGNWKSCESHATQVLTAFPELSDEYLPRIHAARSKVDALQLARK